MRVLFTFACIFLSACGQELEKMPDSKAGELAEAARKQIGVTTRYDPSYVGLTYPGGDVPKETGVCTDVVIRALREMGFDLQQLVHEDMKANFSKYPKIWGLKRPDKNIDHRRVPNLQTYFKRRGVALKITNEKEDYQAGDLVTCLVSGNRPHIMMVSYKKAADGTPYVIHNIGGGTKEESSLFDFKLTGHYRWFNQVNQFEVLINKK